MLTDLTINKTIEIPDETGQSDVHRYFIVNKPYNIVSQFVSSHRVGLLGDLEFKFPEGSPDTCAIDKPAAWQLSEPDIK